MLKKSIFRTIKSSLGRYFAILSIIALGVGFFAGLKVTESSMHKTADTYLNELGLYDFRLVSTLGLTDEDVNSFNNLDGIDKAYGSVSSDVITLTEDGSDTVLHAHTLLDGINGVDIIEGRKPEKPNECLLDALYVSENMLGKKITLSKSNSEETFDTFAFDEYTVVGLVNSSEYINFQRGTTALSNGKATGFVYLLSDGFTTDYFTEIYLKLPGTYEIHSKEYEDAIDKIEPTVKALLEDRADVRYESIYNDAKAEIDDAKKMLSDKKTELADGQKEIDDGWKSYRTEKAMVEKQLNDTKAQLDAARTELDKNWSMLEAAKKDPSATMPQVQAQLIAQEQALSAAEQEYKTNYAAYEKAVSDAKEGFAKTEKTLNDTQKQIDEAKPEIEKAEKEIADGEADLAVLEKPTVYALNRGSNFGYASFENDIQIVSGVAKVFPVFFFLVAALVCITTITRMVGEQRTQNGVLKALGYKNTAISSQYLIYAGSASALGGVIGFFLGTKLLPMILWEVYHIMYSIDRPAEYVFDVGIFAFCLFLYLLCMLGVTYFVCRKDLKTSAAGLMRPAAPSAGKRIFLERIGFIWKPMKFLHKVSVRNILRYKKRMVMMMIGIGGCTALLIAGFGIRDTIQPIVENQYGEINLYDAMVSFLSEPTNEETKAFRETVKDFTSDATFVHSGSMDMIFSGETKPVETVVFSEDMTAFVSLHSGENAVAFPKVNEVAVSHGVAKKLGLSVGDTVNLRNGEHKEIIVTVSGIYDNYIGDIVYLSAETYETAPELNTVYIKFKDETDEHKAGATLLNMDNVAAVSIINDMKETVSGMLDSLNLIVLIVLVCAGALAFIVLYNLTNITITERIREIATLKVLGFHAGEQKSYVFRENIILTVISSIVGIPFGIALLHYTISQIKVDGFYFAVRLAAPSYFLAIGLTLLFTIIVDLALSKKLRKINMAEAMKAIE